LLNLIIIIFLKLKKINKEFYIVLLCLIAISVLYKTNENLFSADFWIFLKLNIFILDLKKNVYNNLKLLFANIFNI